MSDALDKAKGALDQIRQLDEGFDGGNTHHLDLITLARTQAEIAQAEALEEIIGVLRDIEYAIRPIMASSYGERAHR